MKILIEIENGMVLKTPVSQAKDVTLIIVNHDTGNTTEMDAEAVGIKGLKEHLEELQKDLLQN